jgi:hypothetical protein
MGARHDHRAMPHEVAVAATGVTGEPDARAQLDGLYARLLADGGIEPDLARADELAVAIRAGTLAGDDVPKASVVLEELCGGNGAARQRYPDVAMFAERIEALVRRKVRRSPKRIANLRVRVARARRSWRRPRTTPASGSQRRAPRRRVTHGRQRSRSPGRESDESQPLDRPGGLLAVLRRGPAA